MKHHHYPILLMLISILFYACEQNYTMLTEIRHDGSCLRQVELTTRDSAFLTGDTTKNPFPFRLTPEWQIKVYHSLTESPQNWPLSHWTSQDSAYVTASRNFVSAEAMNRHFHFDHSAWKNIKPEINFKKSFRWFYTYYTFEEIYPQFPTAEIPIPLERYMTPEEQILWFQGGQSEYRGMSGQELYDYLGKLADKASAWSNHSLYILRYDVILEFFGTKSNNPFASRLTEARDSIYNMEKNNPDYINDNLISTLDCYFKTDYFSTQYKQQNQAFDSLSDRKFEILNLFELQFKYELLMPGKVISTNASHNENGKLIWKLDAYHFLPASYSIISESRTLNWWAVIITLVLAGSIIYIWQRK